MAGTLNVNVVANEGQVWQGEATSVLVRTTEGDIGLLHGHEPLMAILVPHAAEILTPEGKREVLAIDSGFVSMFNNHVSLISAFGELASEVSVEQARSKLAGLHDVVDSGEATEKQQREYNRYLAQVRAGEKFAAIRH